MYELGGYYTWICAGKKGHTCMTCHAVSYFNPYDIKHSPECLWIKEVTGLAWHREKIDKAIDVCWEKNSE